MLMRLVYAKDSLSSLPIMTDSVIFEDVAVSCLQCV